MQNVGAKVIGPGKTNVCWGTGAALGIAAVSLLLAWNQAVSAVPPGCKPPELMISPEHPLVILYGPGSGELTVKSWQHLPAEIRPYCAVTMDPGSLDLKERLEIWRRMLREVQPHNIPIVLQV